MPATQAQKEAIARRFTQDIIVGDNKTAFLDKTQMIATAEDAYNWAEANQGSYNSALLTIFRANATTKQKAILLQFAVEELIKAS